jgi:hypothetical protein
VRGREVRYFGGLGPGGDASGRNGRPMQERRHSDFDPPSDMQGVGGVSLWLLLQNPAITAEMKNHYMKDYMKFFFVTQIRYTSIGSHCAACML